MGGLEARIITIDGEPWWVFSDICKIVGRSNPTQASLALDEDERTTLDLGLITGPSILVSEAGLYRFLMRSDLPRARPFQKWVTKEVIPSIRKTGRYEFQQKPTPGPVLGIPDQRQLRLKYHENLCRIHDEPLDDPALLRLNEQYFDKWLRRGHALVEVRKLNGRMVPELRPIEVVRRLCN
jgi:hypothetical protein